MIIYQFCMCSHPETQILDQSDFPLLLVTYINGMGLLHFGACFILSHLVLWFMFISSVNNFLPLGMTLLILKYLLWLV